MAKKKVVPYKTPSRTTKVKTSKSTSKSKDYAKTNDLLDNKEVNKTSDLKTKEKKAKIKEKEAKPKEKKVKKKSKVNDLDVTTRIRIDEDRLNDLDSLDTEFLEGRAKRKSVKNSKRVKDKILNGESGFSRLFSNIKKIFEIIFLLIIVILLVFCIYKFIEKIGNDYKVPSKSEDKTEEVSKDKQLIDDNYLFVGDFNTSNFDFTDFDLDYHYVKVSDDDMTTRKLLDDMKKNIYDYNPSIIFIQLGINDLENGNSIDEIINNFDDIVNNIKENRKYASIYIESIYPIDNNHENYDSDFDIDNEEIVEFNEKLKSSCEKWDVNYLDVYSTLNKGDKLDNDYTDDGIHLNEDGYRQVYKVIRDVID